jgi:acyl-CoA synthetase (AMP-forming)/AMP-acid ligase II
MPGAGAGAAGAPTSIPALAQWAGEVYGDAEMVVDGATRLSFRAVASMASSATRAAIATGIRPGDRVAIWAPNSWEWIVAALGALGAGAWLVPVNTRFKGDEAAYVLERVDAAALFTVRGFLDTDYVEMLRTVSPGLRCLDHAVQFAGADDGECSFDEYLAQGQGVDEAEARSRIASVRGDDVADVIFTSGTTGNPKGVMLTHGASIRGYDEWARRFGLQPGDRYLVVNPFFHCFGYKAGWMACLQQGATAYPLSVLDVERVLALVTAERISVLAGPPTLFLSLVDAAARADLRSLRTGFVGASTVAPELLRRIREELPFERLTTGYGLTESTALVSITRAGDEPERISYWNGGFPLDGIEVAIVGDDGHEVPDETPGEILVRGFNVMRGYYDDPVASASVVTDEGWLHTGDIGMRRATGELRISDRKKDIYISGGFNVSPAEVEGLLLRFEPVSQVAVIGVPDPRLGEVGAAFVVARAGTSLCADDVVTWARAHMANYKVPRVVQMVDSLPLNSTGKVMKHELRARVDVSTGAREP